MLAQLQANSQITLPEALVERLGFSVGDEFDIAEHDGALCLTPVTYAPGSAWTKEFISLNGSVDDDTFVEPEDLRLSEREIF